jgi:site-specific recombinase XerD
MSISLVKINSPEEFLLKGQPQSLFDEANQYLRTLRLRGLSSHTLRSYGYDLVHLHRWLGKTNRQIKSLREKDIFEYIDYQTIKNACPRSINRRLSTLGSFSKFCGNYSLFDNNKRKQTSLHKTTPYDTVGLRRYPNRGFKAIRVKVPHSLIDPLEVKEINEFLETVDRYRDLAILFLMLFCGLRSSEVINLLLKNVNFDESQIRVTGKGNRERIMPLADEVIHVMKKYLHLERPSPCFNPYFFTVLQGVRRGESMTLPGLRSLFRYRRGITKIHKARPHVWRHTFGTSMARSSVQLPVLQRLMGHAHPETTLQYIRLSVNDIAEEYHRAVKRIKNLYDTHQGQD